MRYNSRAIPDRIKNYQNAKLTVTPTPIYKLDRLSAYLKNNIFIMREDLTGFGIGGNKVRKLDYLIGDALSKGADTLITWSSIAATNFYHHEAHEELEDFLAKNSFCIFGAKRQKLRELLIFMVITFFLLSNNL